jgi:hypothetical protein
MWEHLESMTDETDDLTLCLMSSKPNRPTMTRCGINTSLQVKPESKILWQNAYIHEEMTSCLIPRSNIPLHKIMHAP